MAKDEILETLDSVENLEEEVKQPMAQTMSAVPSDSSIITGGLKVYDGSQYLVRVAPTAEQLEETDFTQAGETILLYPKDNSLAKAVEQLTESYVGLPTEVIYAGKETVQGDMNMTATSVGLPFVLSRVLGGVTEEANDKSLMFLSSDSEITVSGTATLLKITIEGVEKSITYTGKTVDEVVELINALDDGFDVRAFTLIGGDVNFAYTDTETEDKLMLIKCGDLSTSETKYANTIKTIVPQLGDPDWNNVMIDSPYNDQSAYQFVGVEFTKATITYANSALTEVSTSVVGTLAKEFTGNPTQKTIDNVDNISAQTGNQTQAYCNGIAGASLKSSEVSFEWLKEQDWNMNNRLYAIPRSKYSFNINFEAAFNAQSKYFFEERMNAGATLTYVVVSRYNVGGKENLIVAWGKRAKASPQYPTYAPGSIFLSGTVGSVAKYGDDKSSGFICIN